MRAFLIAFISRLGDSPQSIALRLSRTGSWSLGNIFMVHAMLCKRPGKTLAGPDEF